MESKGLCKTCVHDKGCSFPRRFPIYLCEEFDILPLRDGKNGRNKTKKKR